MVIQNTNPERNKKRLDATSKLHLSGDTPDSKFSAANNPSLVDYKSDGKSAIQYVKTDALIGAEGNEIRSEGTVDYIAEDLNRGIGFKNAITVVLDTKTGKAFITEGNHRLAAARKAGVKYVPIRIVNSQDSEGNAVQLERVGKYVASRDKLDKIDETQDTILPSEVFPDSALLPEDATGFAQMPGGSGRKKYPLPDLSNEDPKEQERLQWYVDADGRPIPKNKLTKKDKTKENFRIRDKENGRVLDGNGYEIEFKPSGRSNASPLPKDRGGKTPVESPETGFWNANEVTPDEVRKNLKTPEEIYDVMYNGGFVEVTPEQAIAAIRLAAKDLKHLGKSKNPLSAKNPNHPKLRKLSNLLASLPSGQENRIRRAVNIDLMDENQISSAISWLESKGVGDGNGMSSSDLSDFHKKFRNLGVDITNMRINGLKAFTQDNQGAMRINMPQLDKKDQKDFLKYMDRLGIGYTETTMRPSELHPIQAEMDMGDVGVIMESWLDPELRKKWKMDDETLFVTRDGYVLDGHHRWSSALMAELAGGKPVNLKVTVLDMDHEEALKFVNEYNDHAGITRQMIGGNKEATSRNPMEADNVGFAQAAGSERAGRFNETAASRKFVDATTEKDAKKAISRWTREENGLTAEITEQNGRFTAKFSDKPKEEVDLGINDTAAFKEAEKQIMLRTAEFDTVDYDGFAQEAGYELKTPFLPEDEILGTIVGKTPLKTSGGTKMTVGDPMNVDISVEEDNIDILERNGVVTKSAFPARYTGVRLSEITGKKEDEDKYIFETEAIDGGYPDSNSNGDTINEEGLTEDEYYEENGETDGFEPKLSEYVDNMYVVVSADEIDSFKNGSSKSKRSWAKAPDSTFLEFLATDKQVKEYNDKPNPVYDASVERSDQRLAETREIAAAKAKEVSARKDRASKAKAISSVTVGEKEIQKGDSLDVNVSYDLETGIPTQFRYASEYDFPTRKDNGVYSPATNTAEFQGLTLADFTGRSSDSNVGLYKVDMHKVLQNSSYEDDENDQNDEDYETPQMDLVTPGYYFLSDADFTRMKSGNFDYRKFLAKKAPASDIADLVKSTADESNAVRKYTGSAYKKINNALRSGTAVEDSDRSIVTGLDSLIAKSKLKSNTQLWRGEFFPDEAGIGYESRKNQFDEAIAKLTPGAEFTDPGFSSTSTSQSGIELFARPVSSITGQNINGRGITYAINAPAGSSGYSIGSGLSSFAEDEVILPRGTKFRVKSVDSSNPNNIFVSLEVVDTPDNTKPENAGFAQKSGATSNLPAGIDQDGLSQEGFAQKEGDKGPKRHHVLEAIASVSNALGLFDEWKGKTSKVREDVNNVGEFVNNMRYVKGDLEKAMDNLKNAKGVSEKMAAISELSAAIKKARLAAKIAKARWKKNHPEDLKPKKPVTPKAIEAPTVEKVSKKFDEDLTAAETALIAEDTSEPKIVDGFAQTTDLDIPTKKVSAKEYKAKEAKAIADNKAAAAEMMEVFRKRIADSARAKWIAPYGSEAPEDPMSAPVNPSNMPFNPSSEHQYSAMNHHALATASAQRGYTDPRWMTSAQAKKSGATVRDGEQGVKIMTYMTIEDEESGERSIVPVPRFVFNAEQMDGLEPYTPQQPKMNAAQALDFVLSRFSEAEQKRGKDGKLKIKEDLYGNDTPMWSPAGARRPEGIRMPDRSKYDSPEDYLYSLFHELAHATGTKDRQGREAHLAQIRGDMTDSQLSVEEATAEIASQLLLQRLGLNYNPNRTAEYLRSHNLNDQELTEAMAKAELSVDYVLGNDVLPPWTNSSTDMMEAAGVPGYTPPASRSWNPNTNLGPQNAPSAFPAGTPGSDENPEVTGFAQKPGKFDRTGKKSVTDSKTATEKVMAGLLEKIKQGETPWRKPYQEGEKYAGIALPRNPSSKHIYSGVNAMALRFAQEENGYSDPRWMTYNQASAMGGQVRKGEKGTFILVPMRITQQDEKDPTKKRSFTMFKATAVFNAEQIDGLNLPELSTESLPKMTPLDAQEFIVERYKKAMAARTGKAPNIKHTYVGSGGAHQAPNWGTLSDEVTLPNLEQFNSPEDLFDTIAHELVHSTGHPDRLDRSDLTKDYANDLESRAKEELIAEIGGALLANMFGVDATFDNSAAYVQSWLKHLQSNPDEIINATSQAQKAVDYILGTDLGDWSPIDGYSIGNAVQKPTKEEES